MTIDLNTILTNALAAAIEQATAPLRDRIAALEAAAAGCAHTNERIDAVERMVRALEEQTTPAAADEHIREIAEAVAERMMSDHNDAYDHDEFLTDDHDFSDAVESCLNEYDFSSIAEDIVGPALRSLLRDATVSIDL